MSEAEVHFEGKIAQKAIIVEGKKVLLMRDPREEDEIWELPGGRMNVGEEPRRALARELKEELGIDFKIHEVIYLEQFFQKNESKQAFVIVYKATGANESTKFTFDSNEVSHLKWFERENITKLKLFPEYKKALEIYFEGL